MQTRPLVYAGISVIAVGTCLFLIFAVINPSTLKVDMSSCSPFGGFGGGTCGMLYGGILPMFFYENMPTFAILSLLLVAFGASLIVISKLKSKAASKIP